MHRHCRDVFRSKMCVCVCVCVRVMGDKKLLFDFDGEMEKV